MPVSGNALTERRLVAAMAEAEQLAVVAKNEREKAALAKTAKKLRVAVLEKEAETARKCFLAIQARINADADPAMADDAWNDAVRLQRELDQAAAEKKALQDSVANLKKELDVKNAHITSTEEQATALSSENKSLKASNAEIKQKYDDQRAASEQTDADLDNAYADLRRKEEQLQKTVKAKEELEAENKDKDGYIKYLVDERDEYMNTLNTVEEQFKDLSHLQRDHEALLDEVQHLRDKCDSHDRLMLVKDARIQSLETQYQKALEGQLSAEAAAAASASAAPADEPQIITPATGSLEDDLKDTDYEDGGYELEQEPLDFSHLHVVADIPPTVGPKLSIGTITFTSTAPVTLQTAHSSTQTETLELPTASTQTEAPKFANSIVQTAIDIAPIEPKKSVSFASTQTDAPPAKDVSHTSTQTDSAVPAERGHETATARADSTTVREIAIQTEPVAEKKLEPTEVVVVNTAEKKSNLGLYWTMSLVFALLSFVLYVQLHHARNANGSSYRHGHNGAFGNGRYLFGFIPVAFDIGETWLSETICRQTAVAISQFESWAGATPIPYY